MMFLCTHTDPCPEVVVFIADYLDPDGIGILVEAATGMATNRFADGVAGIGPDRAEDAEDQTEAWCPVTHEYLTWRADR